MAKKIDPKAGIQMFVAAMFPDDAERVDLLQMALRKLCPEAPKGDEFDNPIDLTDIVIEMVRIRSGRHLVRLIHALEPNRPNRAHALLDDCKVSVPEAARTFGVSDATVINDWIPAGMPVK
jgi:hypothetical protein